MSRQVLCIKYQKRLAGLPRPPFPGSEGEDIFTGVSQQAWDDWLVEQTKLINEYQLSPLDPKARAYLKQQRDHFLHNRPIQSFRSDT